MNDNLDVLFYNYYREKEIVPALTTNLIYSTNLDFSEEKKKSMLRRSIANFVIILLLVMSVSSGIAVYASKKIREKTIDGKTIIHEGEDISDITEPTEIVLAIPLDPDSPRILYTDEELKQRELEMQKESTYHRYKYLMEENNGYERVMTEQEYVYLIEKLVETQNEIDGTRENGFSRYIELVDFSKECLGKKIEKEEYPMTTYEVDGKEYEILAGNNWLVQKKQIFKEMVRNRLASIYGEEYVNNLMEKVDSYYEIPFFKAGNTSTIIVSNEEMELFERIDEVINSGNYEEIEIPALLSIHEEYNILEYMMRSDDELALRLKETFMSREKLRGQMEYKYRHSFPEDSEWTEEMYENRLRATLEGPDWSDDRLYESISNYSSQQNQITNTMIQKVETDGSQNIFVNDRVRE